MLRAHSCLHTVSVAGFSGHQFDGSRLFSSSLVSSSSPLSFRFGFRGRRFRGSKSVIISCRASRGSSGDTSANGEDPDQEYLESFVLIAETVSHHRMRKQGFLEENKWQPWGQLLPFSAQTKDLRADVSSNGQGFLHHFQSPTIFLKVSCDGDFLLPIIVGEFSVERLIDSLREDESVDCPNQFQFMRDLVEKLGYEVKMVKITKRIVSTYFARIYFSKPGENSVISVDTRPSDAINVAIRCKVPIYVNKQIILTDAVRIVYGVGKTLETKSVYDVVLDSASDGRDVLTEELDLVRNMKLAIKEERYNDAALWRDKLMKLRESTHEL